MPPDPEYAITISAQMNAPSCEEIPKSTLQICPNAINCAPKIPAQTKNADTPVKTFALLPYNCPMMSPTE